MSKIFGSRLILIGPYLGDWNFFELVKY